MAEPINLDCEIKGEALKGKTDFRIEENTMAEPTKKSKEIKDLMTALTGQNRKEVIRSDRCMAAPYGCSGSATVFRDELGVREYQISGLYQRCQDGVFGPL